MANISECTVQQTPKPEEKPYSAVQDFLYITYASVFNSGGFLCMCNTNTHSAVVTRTLVTKLHSHSRMLLSVLKIP